MSEEFRTRIALTLQRKFLKMLQSSKIFPAGGRRRRRQYPVHNFVTVTFFVLMTLDTIRAYRHPTMRLWRFAHNRSHVTSAQFLLAQIHADPYTREYCECAVTWFITSQDYHSLSEQKSASLFRPLSVFPLETFVTFLSSLWLPATVYGTNLEPGILDKKCNIIDQDSVKVKNLQIIIYNPPTISVEFSSQMNSIYLAEF